jgi:hypothetical protein
MHGATGFSTVSGSKNPGSEVAPVRVRVGRRLPAGHSVGLGSLIARVTSFFGVHPCGGCARRAAVLDRRVVLTGVGPRRTGLRRAALRRLAATSDDCWRFQGDCTGFGRRRCVSGPARQEPDAEIVEQCCGGWFQYPWIEVCPGEEARRGCGFCFW